MSKITFRSDEHREFYHDMLEKSGNSDSYHKSLFYCIGAASGTRQNINALFDFKRDSIKQDGLSAWFQTDDTTKLTRLAFNLWNGYAEKGMEASSSPDELFGCSLAPYFFEAIKLRYPEYFQEIQQEQFWQHLGSQVAIHDENPAELAQSIVEVMQGPEELRNETLKNQTVSLADRLSAAKQEAAKQQEPQSRSQNRQQFEK